MIGVRPEGPEHPECITRGYCYRPLRAASHHLRASTSVNGGSKYLQRDRNAADTQHDKAFSGCKTLQARTFQRPVPHYLFDRKLVVHLIALRNAATSMSEAQAREILSRTGRAYLDLFGEERALDLALSCGIDVL